MGRNRSGSAKRRKRGRRVNACTKCGAPPGELCHYRAQDDGDLTAYPVVGSATYPAERSTKKLGTCEDRSDHKTVSKSADVFFDEGEG